MLCKSNKCERLESTINNLSCYLVYKVIYLLKWKSVEVAVQMILTCTPRVITDINSNLFCYLIGRKHGPAAEFTLCDNRVQTSNCFSAVIHSFT